MLELTLYILNRSKPNIKKTERLQKDPHLLKQFWNEIVLPYRKKIYIALFYALYAFIPPATRGRAFEEDRPGQKWYKI